MTYNDTSPVSRTEEAANHIIEYITSNRMQPGDRMPTEPELLEQLSVSRTTLREAVKTLSARNILEIRQGSGTYISKRCGVPDDPLGLTFIYDDDRLALNLLDIRMMIEPQAALLAAVYATEHQCKSLRIQCRLGEELIKKDEPYSHEDIKLHEMIAEASGNRVLHNLSYILQTSVEKNIISTDDSLRLNNTLVYHRHIVDAISQHDPQRAYSSMSCHISMLRNFIAAKLSEDAVLP